MSRFKPMLAAECAEHLESLKFPLIASPKLDGIRCIVKDGKALTRSLKEIPNRELFELLSQPEYEGYDGEIIVGSPTDPDVYRRTNSLVMSRDGGIGDVSFYVFDTFNNPAARYEERVMGVTSSEFIVECRGRAIPDLQRLLTYEEHLLNDGFEGVMLRDPEQPYKFGRSTVKQAALLKLKRFSTDEAEVIALVEELANLNEAKVNALGHTERSSHAANKVGKGRLGAVRVRDLKTGVEFEIGSGFTAQEREAFWKESIVGQVVRYRHFPVGVKDKPRFPTFDGLRSKEDMA